MKVITRKKGKEEIISMVEDYGRIFIVGCGTCPTVCQTGGIEQAAEMEQLLKESGKLVTGRMVVNAVCDTPESLFSQQAGKAVAESQVIMVMSCGLGVQAVANYGIKPAIPALDSLFFGIESGAGEYEEICLQCGECVLAYTGGICPVTSCHKGILNGPCGGTNEGLCEVGDGRACAWALIYDRLEKAGKLELMKQFQRPRNFNAHLKPGKWKLAPKEGDGKSQPEGGRS
jgi:ferredoxin